MTREEIIDFCEMKLQLEPENEDIYNFIIKALEQQPCEDAISRKDIYFKLTNGTYPNESIEQFIDRLVKELEDMPPVTPQQPRWIPLSERPLTDEESKEYGAEIGFVYDCELPEDSQDVLVTTPYGVRQTTFYTDYGCYFENYEDEGDVIAWMPLPEPYKAANKNKQGLAYADQDTLMSAT